MNKVNRRSFGQVAVAGASSIPLFSIGKSGRSANSKVNVAMIGNGSIAGMAYDGVQDENVVAVCDVDSATFDKHTKRYPDSGSAKKYEDFRVMLDKKWKDIDMVCVNTPDHVHFPATIAAMERGINVFTQKPLVHNIWEARTLKKAKDKYKVLTNMGNQGHTYDGIRQLREWYEDGIFGQITEAHSYIGGPKWGSKFFTKPELPLSKDKVPSSLNWDLWQGPTEHIPYHENYHPLTWRGFNRYGSGTFGDWFCHVADAPVWLLDLYEPVAVELEEVEGGNEILVPDGLRVRFDFEARGNKAPMTYYWSNGQNADLFKPALPEDWSWDDKPGSGTWYKGTKNNGYTDNRSNKPRLANKDNQREYKEKGYPDEKYARVKGGPVLELVDAIKGNIEEPGANFDYAAPMTETMLLGILAVQHGGRIEWDSKNCKVTNRPELNAFRSEPVRKGWEYGRDLWK